MLSCGEAVRRPVRRRAGRRAARAASPTSTCSASAATASQRPAAGWSATSTALSVTGLTEALRVLPRLVGDAAPAAWRRREQKPPDALVVIDYPDFNFRLMASVKPLGIPVVYYVSPQLWAWRAGRIKTMKRRVDRVLPIFPFEEALYQRAGDGRAVRRPSADRPRRPTHGSRDDVAARSSDLDPSKPVVALLPGSRHNELQRLAPVIAAAVPRIAAAVPALQFVVARAPNLDADSFAPFQASARPLRIADGQTDDVLDASDAVVTASGTATVQAALHGKPMVVIYKLSPMTYRLGKPLARVDVRMVNLIAGERIVVELIQDACTPEEVAREAVRLLTDNERVAEMMARLAIVRARLGGSGASERAAEAILEVAGRRQAAAASAKKEHAP